jgi:hypothetical protein
MKRFTPAALALSVAALVLAACGTAATNTPSPSASPSAPVPSAAPSDAPEETPDAVPEVVGTITVVPAAVDGPGESLASAITGDLSQPVFVRGFLFKETDGQIYFADSMTDGPRVLVSGQPTEGPTWDLGEAGVTGLQEADGVLFYEDVTVYGNLEMS